MGRYAVVDSGTTNTRVRLWEGRGVTRSLTRSAGARDTAVDGHNGKIRQALQEMLAELGGVEAVICSGMITSAGGLLEVPHIPAPAGIAELARAVVRRDFPDIAATPFYFVPGIKTLDPGLLDADIMRGEEAEAIGLRELLRLSGPALLLHCGSHHKVLALDGDGRLAYSRTAITGELLAAVASQTVLKSSLAPLDELVADAAMWRLGLRAAEEQGLGRALFLVRVADVLAGRSPAEATSFLLGALMSQDLPLLATAEQHAQVIIYGKGHFPGLLHSCLSERGRSAQVVPEEMVEVAAAVGAVRIYEHGRG